MTVKSKSKPTSGKTSIKVKIKSDSPAKVQSALKALTKKK